MATVIHKQVIPFFDEGSPIVSLLFPADAVILSYGLQHGDQACVWYETDDENPPQGKTQRTFVLVGTGHPVPRDVHTRCVFVQTLIGDPYVWHLYAVSYE